MLKIVGGGCVLAAVAVTRKIKLETPLGDHDRGHTETRLRQNIRNFQRQIMFVPFSQLRDGRNRATIGASG